MSTLSPSSEVLSTREVGLGSLRHASMGGLSLYANEQTKTPSPVADEVLETMHMAGEIVAGITCGIGDLQYRDGKHIYCTKMSVLGEWGV